MRQKRRRRMTGLCCVMLVLGLLGGCAKPKTIRIGCAQAVQDQIIAWMLCQLGRQEGLDMEVRTVSDGITDLQPALESGSLQIGMEYTQSAWQTVLKHRSAYAPNDLSALLHEYEDRQLTWISLPMVTDHYTLAVSRSLAGQHNLKTVSDLLAVSDQLTLGASTGFLDREDGLPRYEKTYGLSFARTVNLPEDKVIEALRQGSVDVVPAHTLDGELLRSAAVILEDDQSAWPDSTAGYAIRIDTLESSPQIALLADRVGATLTSDQLTFYARLCARKVCTPAEAADVLLKAAGVIEEEQMEPDKSVSSGASEKKSE